MAWTEKGRSAGVVVALALTALGGAPRTATAQAGSPAGPVPAEALEQRRERLADRLDGRVAIFGSAGLKDIEGDYPQDSDFRQDNALFYLTGLEVPGSWLVVGGEGEPTLFLPPRDPAAEVWTGPTLGPGREAVGLSGIADVRSTDAMRETVTERVRGRRVLLSTGDARNAEWIAPALSEARSIDSPASLMAELRLIKDADELRRLQRAIDITAEAHREAWRLAEPDMTEYRLEAAIEYVFRMHGAERLGFPSIVGSGPNSTVLHYDDNRRTMRAGDLVVVDIGAEYGYYSADLTRTFPVSGRFTPRQRAVYELVLGAQNAALAAVRPGVTIAELTRVARQYIDRHSKDLCGGASCNRHFVHGLSHWLGMDVHDVGDYGTPLAAGMVLTVEPGLYLPDEGLGVRIEDDVLVTADGHRLLSGSLPRSPDDIETLMKQSPRWVVGPTR